MNAALRPSEPRDAPIALGVETIAEPWAAANRLTDRSNDSSEVAQKSDSPSSGPAGSEHEAGLGPERRERGRGGVEQGAPPEGVARAHGEPRLGGAPPAVDAGEAAALGELLQQGLRPDLDGPVDQDDVVGRPIRDAPFERPRDGLDPFDPAPLQAGAGGLGHGRAGFERGHGRAETRQDGG